MIKSRASILLMSFAALLSGCGGDSGSTASIGGASSGGGGATGTCSLRARQDWAFATLNEWYLFPETLPASLDPTPYGDVATYIDALTATARGQGRDRYFSYLTSIAEENAFNNSGASAGIGIRLSSDATTKKTFVSEAFEGAPGLAAGLDRGTEILAIGDTAASLRLVSDIITASGVAGVTDALGPTTAGVTRTLRISNAAGVREVTVVKASYSLSPVSTRYGSQVIIDNGRKVGYLNLRTFINTADNQLRSAFDAFRGQGVTDFVIDLRYNGGGLLSTAELMGDLMAGNRNTSEVFDIVSYRATKASRNTTKRFAPQSQSVSPIRIAFIGTGATASASELMINGFIPYLGSNMALVGANTFGKPVGQVAIDQSACDDRFRVIAFSIKNAANSDAYYNGLAATVPNTCKAGDDVTKQFGDPTEASLRVALDFLGGKPCTPIASSGQTAQALRDTGPRLMSVSDPSVAQREVPGLF
jgi:carboxyl-terminal processing protease